jgi:hypothetical protein
VILDSSAVVAFVHGGTGLRFADREARCGAHDRDRHADAG